MTPPADPETPVSGALLLAGFTLVDDPLPYYRLGVEWLTVLAEDYLGDSLRPVQGTAVVFAFFGKDFAADPGNSRRQHHANASERVCQRPSRGVAISLSLRRPQPRRPKSKR